MRQEPQVWAEQGSSALVPQGEGQSRVLAEAGPGRRPCTSPGVMVVGPGGSLASRRVFQIWGYLKPEQTAPGD